MSIKIIKGDLLESNVQYICHQVNCQGKMNSGIAKSIREKWPVAYEEYLKFWEICDQLTYKYSTPEYTPDISEIMLGKIKIVKINNSQSVIHMAAQNNYGYDGKRYTSYDAFCSCLEEIKKQIPKGSNVGFPYKIGSDRGGANWHIIAMMIKEILSDDYNVYIYKLKE